MSFRNATSRERDQSERTDTPTVLTNGEQGNLACLHIAALCYDSSASSCVLQTPPMPARSCLSTRVLTVLRD